MWPALQPVSAIPSITATASANDPSVGMRSRLCRCGCAMPRSGTLAFRPVVGLRVLRPSIVHRRQPMRSQHAPPWGWVGLPALGGISTSGDQMNVIDGILIGDWCDIKGLTLAVSPP
jgi:hypothetical protein